MWVGGYPNQMLGGALENICSRKPPRLQRAHTHPPRIYVSFAEATFLIPDDRSVLILDGLAYWWFPGAGRTNQAKHCRCSEPLNFPCPPDFTTGSHAHFHLTSDYSSSQIIFGTGRVMSGRFKQCHCSMLYKAFGHPGKKPLANAGEDSLIRCVVGLRKPDESPCAHPNGDSHASSDGDDLAEPVTLPGSLLAQTLFRFEVGHPTVLAASLCTQSNERLCAWAKHPMLSRVIEALLNSPSVSLNRKSYLISVFEDIARLSKSRQGSREAEIEFETQTFRSVNSRSNHLGHLAPTRHRLAVEDSTGRLSFRLAPRISKSVKQRRSIHLDTFTVCTMEQSRKPIALAVILYSLGIDVCRPSETEIQDPNAFLITFRFWLRTLGDLEAVVVGCLEVGIVLSYRAKRPLFNWLMVDSRFRRGVSPA
ncbi:hypothetical protein T265_02362 [Opisthorchis viverrini]|uniref:Uncharacterized protein n=1 Tax=Opisthorchis viverrini TaxID=6198 RepID=A0A075A714_OPIVI|nr:hypothetical protein T265_02362 [Opisthorchis viverrini]KER31455.1 hypothetical protein T265_02362 [Opisthorchis viverrini]